MQEFELTEYKRVFRLAYQYQYQWCWWELNCVLWLLFRCSFKSHFVLPCELGLFYQNNVNKSGGELPVVWWMGLSFIVSFSPHVFFKCRLIYRIHIVIICSSELLEGSFLLNNSYYKYYPFLLNKSINCS